MTSAEFSYLASIGYAGSVSDKRNAYYNDLIGAKTLFPVLPAVGDSTARIQAALDAAGPNEVVKLYGVFNTTSTIFVKGNLDAQGADINYSGSGVALQVGQTGAVTFRKIMYLPRVICTAKSGTGWAGVAGTVGILAVNLNSCPAITVPHIQNFESGLIVRGVNQGIVYNNFLLGHLDNNKVNQWIDATGTGWSNQNTFVGGRFSHNSNEGTNVAGVRHILMSTGLSNVPNNNKWDNPSLEGDVAQYQLELSGQANCIDNARWEVTGGGRIWLRADASRNRIWYGYQSDTLVITRETGEVRNHILAPSSWVLPLSGTSALLLENSTSSSNPAINIMDAGGISAGADPITAYCVRFGAKTLSYKRSTDTNERIQIDGDNARIYIGPGNAAISRYLGNLGTSAISMNGGNFSPGVNNTLDLGQTSFLWRYVRAGTAIQTGAFATGSRPAAATAGVGASVFDTTLNKPIWSDGTNWRDAAGTVV